MNIAPDHNKISVTAKLVAYYRLFSDIPFAKDVSEFVSAEETFQQLVERNSLNPAELLEFAPIMEARYKSVVTQLLKSGINQVLELASGFSLRGFAMTRNSSMVYVDTDLEDLTDEKKVLIASLEAEHPASNGGIYHAVSANALDLDQLRAALKSLDRSQPLAVINEGLIQYFSISERDLLIKNVRQLLGEFHGGVWITPDFSTKEIANNVSSHRKRMRQLVTGLTDRTLYDSAFDTEDQMNKFFEHSGFSAQVYNQIEETPNFVSAERLDLPAALLEQARSKLKLWVLRPS